MQLSEFKDMMKDLGLVSVIQDDGVEFYLDGMPSIGYLAKVWNLRDEQTNALLADEYLANIWKFHLKKIFGYDKQLYDTYIEPVEIDYSERLDKIDKKTVFQKITKTLAKIKDFKQQIRKELIKSI